jgi:hypothetical protein
VIPINIYRSKTKKNENGNFKKGLSNEKSFLFFRKHSKNKGDG